MNEIYLLKKRFSGKIKLYEKEKTKKTGRKPRKTKKEEKQKETDVNE